MSLDYFQHKVLTIVYRNKHIYNLTEEDLDKAKKCVAKFDSVKYPCAPSSIAATIIYHLVKSKDASIKIEPFRLKFVTNIIVFKRNVQKKVTRFTITKWKDIIKELME
ncbi:MAG: hypothetical protein B6229_04755 [Spirochaetaceae bacterium 4572_7]|nr:MAG: hypothetical protein B6229_04755 [Spirochaetaceae bacterium 4572_7]